MNKMKNILLSLACFFACKFSIQAQTLYGLTRYGGSNDEGAIIKFIPGSNNLTVARPFEDNARYPGYSNFIQASDGKLYYTAVDGGSSDYGAIFSYDPSSSTYTRLKNFDHTNGAYPGGLMQANNGKFYGMTWQGGSSDNGVIFSYDPSSSILTKLKVFDGNDGSHGSGSLIQASDGKLYGMTREGGSNGFGVIFSFDPSTFTYTKLKDFDGIVSGSFPNGNLVQASNGKLYGMTNSGGSSQVGVIFSYDLSTSTYTKLYDFDNANGANPNGNLMQAGNGKLYGMTMQGGSNQHGVIFSFDPSSNAYTKLKDFYGSSSGAYPAGSLLKASDGKLYGMTVYGWSIYPYPGYGFIFSFDPSSNAYTKLKDFDNPNESPDPYKNLMQANDGKLYGISNFGVIFSYTLSNSAYTKLMDLNVNDGRYPYASLVKASDGKLYGITNDGGSGRYPDGGGVIFSFDPASSVYRKLADFTGYTNGSKPFGSLMQASNGKLYGMTWGGSYYDPGGAIFSFDLSTCAFTKLMNFADGFSSYAYGSLIQASDGKLYGMTSGSAIPSNVGGTIFSYNPLTSVYTKLVDFTGSNGGYPTSSLVKASNGKLYGMTTQGGRNGYGVIFSFDPVSSVYKKLEDFDGTNGAYPYGSSLVQASDGKLYGMANGGGSGDRGVIFSFELQHSKYTKLVDFDSTNGAYPTGNLMQASDGKLYGMATSGGTNNLGVIFSFDPSSSTFTKLKDLNGANGAHPSLGAAFIEVSNSPLPVTLLNFNGELINDHAVLHWSTTDEINNKGFDVERSKDGVNFSKIGFVEAKGNSTSISYYSFTDINFKKPVSYYRLKQIDIDGNFKYSRVIKINASNANTYQLVIAPNPSSYQTTISFSLPQPEKVSLKVFDLSGRLITVLVNGNMQAGNHEVKWKLNDANGKPVPTGVYFLRMEADNYSETKKLIVI